MAENQNIEYKSRWQDEYLKWICGFANANGGTIFIGMDDNGKIVGVENAKQLLEEIPNKVRDILGILVDVNLYETKQGKYIEIVVDPYPNPVNYKGQYHYRSGSTKQELRGAALDKFLLQKNGKRWDGVVIPNVSIQDLDTKTIDFFQDRGIKSNRLLGHEKNIKNLLENLKLIEDGKLKRAAVLLFHADPEKYITGAFIKIGYFQNEADLIFQDEINGNLIDQVEKTIELLFTKYIKATVSYEGIHRIETYEYPKPAIREALLNAVAHKDYSGSTPIQIRVYDNKMMIWNQGHLPDNWTVNTLLKNHSSRPYNPDIANTFFRSGYIESWGRGIRKMIELCLENNQPKPTFQFEGSDCWVIFKKDIFTIDQIEKLGLNERQIKAVLFTKTNGKITNGDYQQLNNCSRNTATNDLSDLINKGIIKSSGKSGAGSFYTLI